jgi:hypothetical protein
MEKLQPFIKYHFWLLFVPAFIMPPAAWWMTTSSLQATIDERTAALNKSHDSIPKGNDTPNEDWIDKADAQIGIRTETNIRTGDRLWDWQKTLVKWPLNVAKYMDACKYRGAIADPAISRRVPIDYRRDYPQEVRRVWLLADPIGKAADPIPPTAAKKVWFPLDDMPQVSSEKWRNLPPSFIEIWNSQEDLWLLEQILLAVQRTNSSSSSITDSFVRQIQEVALFGGDRIKPNEVGGGAAASGNGAPDGGGLGALSMPKGFPTNAGRGQGHRVPTSARFNLAEEFNAKGLTSKSGRSSSANAMPDPTVMGSGPGSNNAGAAAADDLNVDENRYITVADAYRTRGFQLVVTVHQQYVPDLVRELLNSQYPISIIRMEQTALHPDEPDGSSTDTRGGPRLAAAQPAGPGAGGVFPAGEAPKEFAEAGVAPEGEGADPFAGEEGATTTRSVTNEAVSAALEELDLVEVMIVGELYLYNPPPVPEGDPTATTDNGAEPPPEAAPVQPEEPVQPEDTVQPVETALPAAVTEPATDPESTTPAPTTPAPATPAPATPESTTSPPNTDKPAS